MYPHIYTPTLMHVAYAFKGSRSSGVLPREKLPGWLKGAVSAFDPNKNEGHDYYLVRAARSSARPACKRCV